MKNAQKFGLISGLFSGSWMILEYYLGLQDRPEGRYTGYLGLFVFTLCIVFSIFYTRERELGGRIDFKTALRSGVITAAISALVTGLFYFIYCKWVNPEWLIKQHPEVKPEEVLKAKSLGGLLQMSFLLSAVTTLMGSAISALFALVLKKRTFLPDLLMDIKKALIQEHSKKQSLAIAAYVGHSKKRFRELMKLMLSADAVLAQRASWAVNKCCDSAPELILPYLKETLENLSNSVHNAVKRNTLSILEQVEIPEELMGLATDACFRLLISTGEAVAVKAYAMTVLANIARKEPGLSNEIRIVVEGLLPYGKPAVVSRGKKVLKALEKLK